MIDDCQWILKMIGRLQSTVARTECSRDHDCDNLSVSCHLFNGICLSWCYNSLGEWHYWEWCPSCEQLAKLCRKGQCASWKLNSVDGCVCYFRFRWASFHSVEPCTQLILWRRICWNVHVFLGWMGFSAFPFSLVPTHHPPMFYLKNQSDWHGTNIFPSDSLLFHFSCPLPSIQFSTCFNNKIMMTSHSIAGVVFTS